MSVSAGESSLHFTYRECDAGNIFLKQGDILQKTPELLGLLQEVHPHYTNPEYKYFQVVTQSCDLVRKNYTCKSRYITLAAVRTLDDMIDRFIEENVPSVIIDGVYYCSENHRSKVTEFLRKLFNNNQKEYFFLQKSPTHGIEEHCCTLLYLTIAIRAYEHYDLCLNAKCLELVDNFQSKLGWLVGNLYSRVGTDDYVPSAVATDKQLKEILSELAQDHAAWVPQVRFAEFKKIAGRIQNIEVINSEIETNLKRKRDSKLASILTQVKSTITLSDDDEKKFANLISNDPLFKKLLT